jgi:hypothetical protein
MVGFEESIEPRPFYGLPRIGDERFSDDSTGEQRARVACRQVAERPSKCRCRSRLAARQEVMGRNTRRLSPTRSQCPFGPHDRRSPTGHRAQCQFEIRATTAGVVLLPRGVWVSSPETVRSAAPVGWTTLCLSRELRSGCSSPKWRLACGCGPVPFVESL